jgi:hypothetical protein
MFLQAFVGREAAPQSAKSELMHRSKRRTVASCSIFIGVRQESHRRNKSSLRD